jgi:Fe-S cluster biosynthesis and repair protein YggX
MADRVVRCARLGADLPGLPAPPFPGALGQRIFEHVSRPAWQQWEERAAGLIQEQGLSLGHPQARKLLLREMEAFLFPPEPVGSDAPAAAGPTVFCLKLGRTLPALKAPPFPGALGQRIFDSVSAQAWALWEEQALILMNHYALSLADPEARSFLLKAMEEFFFGAGARLPADWAPPATGAKGGGKAAPAPQRK